MTERRFDRDVRSLAPIVDFVNEFLAARGLAAERAYDVHLIVEELFTNMVKYSRESRERIEIGLEWSAPELTVRLRDFDVEPFDVTRPAGVDVNRPIDERDPGGLVLHFVQQAADALEYAWASRTSTITVRKRLD